MDLPQKEDGPVSNSRVYRRLTCAGKNDSPFKVFKLVISSVELIGFHKNQNNISILIQVRQTVLLEAKSL